MMADNANNDADTNTATTTTTTAVVNQETVNIPDYLRPLHDEWFGETSAPFIFRAVNLENWDICQRLLASLETNNDASTVAATATTETETRCGHRSVVVEAEEKLRHDLNYVDMYGYSALHYACWWRSTPYDIITQLVELSPSDYPALRNRKGRTPLHLAAWRGQDEVLQLIARKCPKAATIEDKNQKSALSDACSRNRSKLVLQALIEADPTQILKANNQGRTPAHTFFRISHGHVEKQLVPGTATTTTSNHSFDSEEPQREYVEKVILILEAERFQLNQSKLRLENLVELLHAAIESPSCSFAFIQLLLSKIHPRAIDEYTYNGNTLLHIALKSAKEFEHDVFYKCDRCGCCSSGGSNNLSTSSRMTIPATQQQQQQQQQQQKQMRMYFNRDPNRAHWGVRCNNCSPTSRQAIMMHYVQIPIINKHAEIMNHLATNHSCLVRIRDNDTDSLPLEIALKSQNENHCNWYMGIQELVKSYPGALSKLESSTKLFPFLLAATIPSIDDDDEKETDSDGYISDNDSIGPQQPPRKRRRKLLNGDGDNNNNIPQAKVVIETTFQILRECPNLIKMAHQH